MPRNSTLAAMASTVETDLPDLLVGVHTHDNHVGALTDHGDTGDSNCKSKRSEGIEVSYSLERQRSFSSPTDPPQQNLRGRTFVGCGR